MESPAIPFDEEQRIKALHSLELLDTGPEERFDRLTRLAKRIFNVPVALVSLVDTDRQWFKSRPDFPIAETGRDVSFCGHTILDDEIFIVEDTLQDGRFADNPLVTGFPEIRFYAGYPIMSPDGRKIGTICIIDKKPRMLSNEDIILLRDLAVLVEREINAVHLATHDELTKILNRRGFDILTHNCLNMCSRLNIPVSLIIFDLNKFKTINDNFGHHEGDRALRIFALGMSKVFRTSDVICRLGGDEFVAFLVNSDAETAENAIGRLEKVLKIEKENSNLKYAITFSEGLVSVVPGEETDLGELLHEADIRMYHKKRESGACER